HSCFPTRLRLSFHSSAYTGPELQYLNETARRPAEARYHRGVVASAMPGALGEDAASSRRRPALHDAEVRPVPPNRASSHRATYLVQGWSRHRTPGKDPAMHEMWRRIPRPT